MKFADRLQKAIVKSGSFFVAGFDPRLDAFPRFVLEQAEKASKANEEAVYKALTHFYEIAIEALSGKVAAVKPNLAFFESYGLGGIRALASIFSMLKAAEILIVADGKRGDIGSTAEAYSSAYLGMSDFFGKRKAVFDVDALTVNPFLGFDTLEPFLKDCREYNKGLFVLARTSNPGAESTQDKHKSGALTLSESIITWLHENGESLKGDCGYSGLGAVVGATFPDQARALRKLAPNTFFLIPGFGSQGAGPSDAVAGFSKNKGGAIINVTRALFDKSVSAASDENTMKSALSKNIDQFNKSIREVLK